MLFYAQLRYLTYCSKLTLTFYRVVLCRGTTHLLVFGEPWGEVGWG